MSVSTEIQRIKGNIASAYTSASGKGATMPAVQNSANLAGCIDTITGGGEPVAKTKYGVSIDDILGDVDENGAYVLPTTFELKFSGCTTLSVAYCLYGRFGGSTCTKAEFPDLQTISGVYACAQSFYRCLDISELSLPNLETISGRNGCYQMFYACSSLKVVDMKNLKTVQNAYACESMFSNCTKLTEIDLSSLETISGASACKSMFYSCSALTTVNLSNLSVISGGSACVTMFAGCKALTRVDFPSLVDIGELSTFGTSSTTAIFYNCPNLTEIHFRAGTEAEIQQTTATQWAYGATNATIFFDL